MVALKTVQIVAPARILSHAWELPYVMGQPKQGKKKNTKIDIEDSDVFVDWLSDLD